MRSPALEIIGIARPENAPFIVDSHLDPTADHNAALLPLMDQRDLASIPAGFVAFLQDLQRPAEQVLTDLPVRAFALTDLDQFARP